MISDDDVMRLFERADPARADAAAVANDAAGYLDALRTRGSTVTMIDTTPAPPEPTSPRRWRVVAVAAALVLIAGSVLAWAATEDDPDAHVPAGTSTTSSTVPASGPVDVVLPPEGAPPSTPATGELVAAIEPTPAPSSGGGATNLYADGRLIWYPSDVPGRIAEQRLTPEGVERVRMEFLSVVQRVLDTGEPGMAWSSCLCTIRVRDGGRLVTTDDGTYDGSIQVEPQVERDIDHLVELFTDLKSSLPASAWEDREIRPYVPSRYQFCVSREPSEVEGDPHVPDRSKVLAQLLPTPLVELLDEQGWRHLDGADCVWLSTADARVLAEWLIDAGRYNGAWIGGPVPTRISFGLRPLLPDGQTSRL